MKKQDGKYSFNEGDVITLQANVFAVPQYTAEWLLNGKKVVCRDNVNYFIKDDLVTLVVEGCEKIKNEGTYQMVASNQIGENSCAFDVTILC